ncbi:MAG TPA: hypothetical protein VHX86_12585 [Tepidisphaeraceae bacterium]|jgi:hypothetical protein|nr:hypothetical protein [Tepidisphaeraceae bacterium]
MSDAARRKEHQRLKREKKKAQMRRAVAGSPYKRVGQIGKLEACYINADWQTSGLASIHLVRQNPQGGFALACFLIDLWCAGLKDAWGELDMLHDEIDRHVNRAQERFELARIEPDIARMLVAGAIRFARQNGFRLPPHHDRWVNLLGDVPNPATADLLPFGKDGGLLWIGPLDDLRRRLVVCSLDEFLARPDVHYVSGIEDFGAPESDDEDFENADEELDEAFNSMVEQICGETHRRCREAGEEPLPLIHRAAECIVATLMALPGVESTEETDVRRDERVENPENNPSDDPEPEMKAAIEQILRMAHRAFPRSEESMKSPEIAQSK